MKFPTRQADISQMAYTMLKGYFQHSEDFPSVNRTALLFQLNKYKNFVKSQLDKQAAFVSAIENKNRSLDSLQTIMKGCIKKSIVDTKDNPAKMALIGWGPRANPHPESVPGPPKNLITTKKDNLLYLLWEKPASNVNCYIVECRVQSNKTLLFGPWQITATSLDTNIELKSHPKAIYCEYRVIAVNSAGKSMPSNTTQITF